jgi:biotin carboxylase
VAGTAGAAPKAPATIPTSPFHCGFFPLQRFIITGYSMLINQPLPFFEKLKEALEAIVKARGMEMGTCHLEIRQIQGEWKFIEINPRISGWGMNRLIGCGLGINLVEVTIKMALGQKPDLQPKKQQYVFSLIHGFVTPRKSDLPSPAKTKYSTFSHFHPSMVPPGGMGGLYNFTYLPFSFSCLINAPREIP